MKDRATLLQLGGLVSGVAAGACVSLFWALTVLAVGLLALGVAEEIG